AQRLYRLGDSGRRAEVDQVQPGKRAGHQGQPAGNEQSLYQVSTHFFFFKQKTAYEIGLGIPAEPLFRSKTRYMHKMRCLLINRRSLLLALRLLWKTPIFPSNSRFPRLCAKCLLKLKRLVSILPMTKSKK